MISKPLILNLFLTILLASFSQSTVARNKSNVSLEDASEFIREQSKGKVLSARTTNFNGEKKHRIQVLTPSGRVKIFQVPTYINPKQRRSNYNNGMGALDNTNKNINKYYQNNSSRNRSSYRNSNTTRYSAPKNHSIPNSSTQGESKQK